MFSSTIFAFCLAALAVAAPSPTHNGGYDTHLSSRGLVTFVMTEPDCPSLQSYCTHCNGDFNCETDPRCEWCYQHGAFGSST